jgi:hypothetical protein
MTSVLSSKKQRKYCTPSRDVRNDAFCPQDKEVESILAAGMVAQVASRHAAIVGIATAPGCW